MWLLMTLRWGGRFDTQQKLEQKSSAEPLILSFIGEWRVWEDSTPSQSLSTITNKDQSRMGCLFFGLDLCIGFHLNPVLAVYAKLTWRLLHWHTEPLNREGAPVQQPKSRPNHKSTKCKADKTDRPWKSWQILDTLNRISRSQKYVGLPRKGQGERKSLKINILTRVATSIHSLGKNNKEIHEGAMAKDGWWSRFLNIRIKGKIF